jgi:hypothetical protein
LSEGLGSALLEGGSLEPAALQDRLPLSPGMQTRRLVSTLRVGPLHFCPRAPTGARRAETLPSQLREPERSTLPAWDAATTSRSALALLARCIRFALSSRWPERGVLMHSASVRAGPRRLAVFMTAPINWDVATALPNVRAKRATTAGRQARAGENVPRTTGPGLAACRWRSA